MSENAFQGQVALVTGASRGIGAAIAQELAQRGASQAGAVGDVLERGAFGIGRRTVAGDPVAGGAALLGKGQSVPDPRRGGGSRLAFGRARPRIDRGGQGEGDGQRGEQQGTGHARSLAARPPPPQRFSAGRRPVR